MPVPHGFVEKLAELSAAGKAFVSVTLVETVGSTPSDAGTKMLVDETGLIFGTVGGGRVENKSILHAQSLLTRPRTIRRATTPRKLVRSWNGTCNATSA